MWMHCQNPQNLLKNDIEKRFGVLIREENKKIVPVQVEEEDEKEEQKSGDEEIRWAFERDPSESYDIQNGGKKYSYFTKEQEEILNFYAKKNYVGTFPIPSSTEWNYEVTFGKSRGSPC